MDILPFIQDALETLEHQERVQILWACESGSRAWGFPSPDSDYDVRFIYVRSAEDYLSLSPKADTLERQLEHDLDISGWDLRKTLTLMQRANASVFEWLVSPIIYRDIVQFSTHFKSLLPQYFNPRPMTHHYLGLGKKYHERIQKEQVRYKDYCYILRALLSARWICTHQTQPPLIFQDLLVLLSPEEAPILEEINTLIAHKLKAREKDTQPKSATLTPWLTQELERLSEQASTLEKKELGLQTLDAFFLKTLSLL